MSNSVVHVVYKTHLDIGFTALANEVIAQYMEQFIPRAIQLADEMRAMSERRFRWTTGAWLIYEYLERASASERRRMEAAIEAGDIVWHALPFTTHTELLDASLFREGLRYARVLDRRFGRVTIAAKMTDVPGHTQAIVPLLAEAGIKLLHIGVNQASSVPEVPPVFRWRDPTTGHELLVVYDHDYGGLTSLPFLDHHLALVLTGDNFGPPPLAQIMATYDALHHSHPNAAVVASTMDAFATALDRVRDRLPVVSDEIGDTWIHGVGSDPTKVRQYRELCRLRRKWLAQGASEAALTSFSHLLLLIAEHTWGLDEKVHFPNTTDYYPDDLARVRHTPQAQHFEASWREQRAYLTEAISALPDFTLVAEAQAALAMLTPIEPDLSTWQPTDTLTLIDGSLTVTVDPQTGSISHMVQGEHTYADPQHSLGGVSYQVFGQTDYNRYWSQYIRNGDMPEVRTWAWQDNTKPGLPIEHGQVWQAQVTGLFTREGCGLVALTFPPEAVAHGAPARLYFELELRAPTLKLRFSWFGKRASRLAEALWMSFVPVQSASADWRIRKLGQWIDPLHVVSRGARTLHAIEEAVECGRLRIITRDAPLVSLGAPALLDFHNRLPSLAGGVHFNLYNNVWGTNFPMWFDDDAMFRFEVTVGEE